MNKASFLLAFYSDAGARRACIIRCLNEGGPINDLAFLAAAHLYSESPHKATAWAIQAAFCNGVSPYKITPFVTKGNAAAKKFVERMQYLVVDIEESQAAQQQIQLARSTGGAFGTFKATLMSAHKRYTGARTRKADTGLFEGLMYEVSKDGSPLAQWIHQHSGEGIPWSSAASAKYLSGLRGTLQRGAGTKCFSLECFEPLVVV